MVVAAKALCWCLRLRLHHAGYDFRHRMATSRACAIRMWWKVLAGALPLSLCFTLNLFSAGVLTFLEAVFMLMD